MNSLLTEGDHSQDAGGVNQLVGYQIGGKCCGNGEHDLSHLVVENEAHPKCACHSKSQTNSRAPHSQAK